MLNTTTRIKKRASLLPEAIQMTEYDIQCSVVEYLELLQAQGKILLFTAIPNSTYTTSWQVKVKNRRLGVRPGLSDLVVVTHDSVLFIELKREKKGVVSAEQKEWLRVLQDKKVTSVVCKGFDNAKEFIDQVLEKERTKHLTPAGDIPAFALERKL